MNMENTRFMTNPYFHFLGCSEKNLAHVRLFHQTRKFDCFRLAQSEKSIIGDFSGHFLCTKVQCFLDLVYSNLVECRYELRFCHNAVVNHFAATAKLQSL